MSDTTGEATINPDGTTTTTNDSQKTNAEYQQQQQSDEEVPPQFQSDEIPENEDGPVKVKGTDPSLYLALSFISFVILYMLHYKRQKKKQMEREAFFFDMDGDKFDIQLPDAVEEYYEVKEKCIKAGWESGKVRCVVFLRCVTLRHVR